MKIKIDLSIKEILRKVHKLDPKDQRLAIKSLSKEDRVILLANKLNTFIGYGLSILGYNPYDEDLMDYLNDSSNEACIEWIIKRINDLVVSEKFNVLEQLLLTLNEY